MNAKKIFFAGVCLLAACFTQAQEESQSQMPKAFSYQAVVRDNAGKVVADKEVGVKIEILKGSAESGEVVYSETLTPTSTKTGTVNMMIGNGDADRFAAIEWGGNAHFLRISLSLDGGEYKVVSTTQMLPVPYALYAEKAGSVVDNGSGGSTEPDTPEISENNKPLFSLVPLYQGSYPMDLMKALSGETVVLNNLSFLVFYIQYLTGIDLQLTAEIEGCEVNSEYSSESTEYGRVYTFKNPTVETVDEINTKLIIKDKDGNILKSYPFKYKKFTNE